MKLRNLDSSERPYVSISCITYNQVDYIGKTIECFLEQDVDFPVEILIHDDASTDGTQKIIKKYQEKYPKIIKPVLQKENQFSKGVKCIHYTFNFKRSLGKYIATCEGDDFFVKNNKLKRQVKVLDENPNYSMCSHEAYFTSIKYRNNVKSAISILYRNLMLSGFLEFIKLTSELLNNKSEFWNKRRSRAKRKAEADLQYLLKTYHQNIYIPTVSIMGRADIFRSIPNDLLMTPTGHKEHIFWAALHGKIIHLSDVMGQRNQQANSLTISKLHRTHEDKERYNHFKAFYSTLKVYSNKKQKEQISKALSNIEEIYG